MDRAIILNSFGRGGSNILASMIGSSPSVLMAAHEFWQFYYNGWNLPPRIYRRLGIGPGKLASRSMFFRGRFQKRLNESIRESIATDYQLRTERRIDLKFVDHVLFKVTEYDIFLNYEIEQQFSQTVFIGLVRDGYGLCDSWMRRGMPAKMAGRMYAQIAGKMIAERHSRKNYMLVRFEDMISDPLGFLDRLYECLVLPPPDEASYIYRPKGYGPGQESGAGASRATCIVSKSYWATLLAQNINAAAAGRLTPKDLRDFNHDAFSVMEELYELRWK
jgi:hypothetical protein